ncbi:phosphatidylinositol-binding clathrin assembly protein-like [Corticium candelabrum]|uniref:phosphatidylinositol-binding clathrin assembly protein-like n=1 Tax=Corticium candelabrum TaxID=121492 RepID=UPI002E25A649|nr:phosphatidylinositol-binding clathrin assembly protein-like [Corticium candelabrum]
MSVADRLTAGVHTLTGQHLAKVVAKASSHEVMGPKKKHVDTLIALTNSPTFSMPDLGSDIFSRCQNSSWIVVFKALITCHNLMSRGHERFLQYVASRTSLFVLDNFLDKGGLQAYDMSTFIRRYANFLNEKAFAYRQMGYDFCRVSRGKEDGYLRTLDQAKLLQALPVLERLVDALLAMEVTAEELTNGVINGAFVMLFRDLIKLFTCYNDGVINLLAKFYELKKQQARDGLALYRKFVVKMDRINEFMKVAKEVGVEREGEATELTRPPSVLLETLESYVRTFEKGGKVDVPANIQSLSQSYLSSTSPPQGTSLQNSPLPARTQPATVFVPAPAAPAAIPAVAAPLGAQTKLSPQDIAARRRHLEIEKARLLELKQQQQKSQQPGNDLAELESAFGLQSGQPAAQMMQQFGVVPQSYPVSMTPQHAPVAPAINSTADPWATVPSPTSGFNAQFEVAFGETRSTAPPAATQSGFGAQPYGSQPPGLGDMLEPMKTGQFTSEPEKVPGKGLGKDLSSGLNKAIEDLDLGKNKYGFSEKTHHQWKEPSTQKTGGANWAPMQRQTVTVPQQQQQQQQGLGSRPADWSSSLPAGHFPVPSTMQPQMQPMMQPSYRPMQPGVMGGAPQMGMQMYPQQMMGMGMGMGMGMSQPRQQQSSRPADPFGPI